MTLLQLKRHMDRRFDRLRRTKADKAALARHETTMRIQFDSLNEKIDSVLRIVRDPYSHHGEVPSGPRPASRLKHLAPSL